MIKRIAACIATIASVLALAFTVAAPAYASYQGSCFGYTGTFADPVGFPTLVHATFPDGSQNCFGISPGRQVWDTHPGQPWYVIPGGGRADGIEGAYWYNDGVNIEKIIRVWVAGSGNFWCQSYVYGGGWQTTWHECNSGPTPFIANSGHGLRVVRANVSVDR